jgi:group I intron endonuclease
MKNYNSGVYKITNTQNGHFYLGSTVDFSKRWTAHKYDLSHNKHINPHFQRAWNIYGQAAFIFEIVCTCPAIKNILIFYEQHHLDKYWDNCKICYNILKLAHTALGYRHTPSALKLMSEAQKGNKKNLGHTHSETVRKNMSIIALNMTLEHKQKISKSKIGKPCSEETKRKIALTLKGRAPSKEALEKGLETKRKKNLPSPLRGRKASEETKQKMSASLKDHIGCSHTEETKQRLREAAIRQWERKKLQDKGGV